MRYKFTILNLPAYLFLLGLIINTIVNYPALSKGEGWGVIFMIGLGGLALIMIVIDLILQNTIKNKTRLLIVSIVVLIVCIFLFFAGI